MASVGPGAGPGPAAGRARTILRPYGNTYLVDRCDRIRLDGRKSEAAWHDRARQLMRAAVSASFGMTSLWRREVGPLDVGNDHVDLGKRSSHPLLRPRPAPFVNTPPGAVLETAWKDVDGIPFDHLDWDFAFSGVFRPLSRSFLACVAAAAEGAGGVGPLEAREGLATGRADPVELVFGAEVVGVQGDGGLFADVREVAFVLPALGSAGRLGGPSRARCPGTSGS
jgi:hypothetical protein